ncbi:hypothetical protein GCM10009754_67930 [Amycolatopsis minnesotensis]|uniref:Uncharacterized protein n=1 Tax=Amycolatopsis minnesotensis TaxID=337894 RepID=A0ABP5DJR1_9PSEU
MGNSLGASAYRTAEKLLFHNRSALVRGGKVEPNWLDGGDRFFTANDTGTLTVTAPDGRNYTEEPPPR